MRRRIIVKFNCLVLLFASVSSSYGLNTEYRRVLSSSSSSLHPFKLANKASSRTVTGYNVKTQTFGGNVPSNSNNNKFTSTSSLGSLGNYYPFGSKSSRTTATINSDGTKTVTTSNLGTSGSLPFGSGQSLQTTHVKRCYTKNGVRDCTSTTHQQNIHKNNVLTITISELSVNTIIWKLQQFAEYRNDIFDICTCKNYADCSCTNKITSYTITKPCYCLCLQEYNGESKCICNSHAIQLQIKSDVTLKGCLCYNTGGTGYHLKCTCRKIENEDTYDSNKYTSIEIQLEDTKRIENFRDVLFRKFSREDQGIDECFCTAFAKGCRCRTIKYTHNALSNCLCLNDYVDPNYPFRCICGLYVLQPNIKYSSGNLQRCNCIFTQESSICRCNQYGGRPVIKPNDIHEDHTIYDYSKVVLRITKYQSIENIIWKLKQHREFQNEKFDICTYNRYYKEWSLTDKTASYTLSDPCSCLCPPQSDGDTKCICNPHILQPQFQGDATLEGCLCYSTGGAGSKLKCTCRRIENERTYNSNKYTSIELQLEDTKRIENFRDVLFTKFSREDQGIDVCSCTGFAKGCRCRTIKYTHNALSNCLCLNDYVDPNYPFRCICGLYVLQPNIKYSSGNLQRCNCIFTQESSICRCNQNGESPVIKPKDIDEDHTIYDYSKVVLRITKYQSIENIIWKLKQHREFQNEKFDICTYYRYYKEWSLTDKTARYTKAKPCRCLCPKQNNDDTKCICNPHILEVTIKSDVTLESCLCYNTDGSGTYLECNCQNVENSSGIHSSEGIFNLMPLGEIGIEGLRQYIQDSIEFRDEKLDTCYMHYDQKILEGTCEHTTNMGGYKYYDKSYCLCLAPKRNLIQVNCVCNPKILTRQFRYNINLYTLKACLCVRKLDTRTGLACRCSDINANSQIDDKKYSSTIVELPSNSMKMMQIRDYIIPALQEVDKGYDLCKCYSGDKQIRGECKLHYPVNGLSPCLCLMDFLHTHTCICNQYVLQLKIRYNPVIIRLKACYCLPDEKLNSILCKCSNHWETNQGPTQSTTTTTTTTTTTPTTTTLKPMYYNYENILLIVPEKVVTLSVLHREFVNSLEFKDEQFNICACIVKPGNKYKCSCNQSTKLYTKAEPCLCIHSYVKNSMEECLCSAHVLQPKISYSKNESYLLDCTCYGFGTNVNSLSCDYCKPKNPYSPDYGSVLINIRNEVWINIVILLDYFKNVEEYRLERFNTCTCRNSYEKLPCSCIMNYYQYAKHKSLNCLCIVYKTMLKKLSQCLCSHNVLLADIVYNINLIELQECVCSITSSESIDPTCYCKRKASFNPNYQILIEFEHKIQIRDITRAFRKQEVFRHEHFIQCTYSHDSIKCLPTENRELFIYQNMYNCLCIYERQNNNQPNCLCSINVLKPEITYDTKSVKLQACTCSAWDFKCNCNTKPSYDPYDILIEFHEVTVHIVIIFRYLKERWEFQYEVFNKCTGTKYKSALTLTSCKENTQLCTENNKCNCLCVFHKSSITTECLCSSHVLRPSITYNTVVNKLQACRCYHKNSALYLTCSCEDKISFEPKYDSILIVFENVTITTDIILKEFKKYWEYRHEVFNTCNGLHSNSSLTINCLKNTNTCMKDHHCNCLCVFLPKKAECLCSSNILEPGITYNTSLNNLQACRCIHESNTKQLTCKCVEKESFEPKYELILMEFKEVTIYINMILKYLEDRSEFKYENFNSCNGTSLESPLPVTCIKPTSECHSNHCNCLCVLDEAASVAECLCSVHVLVPNITYNSIVNNIQACKCYHNGNVADKSHHLNCNCVRKVSFEPKYENILIEWHQITIHITIILTYLRQKWEFQYEVYNVCKGTNLKLPLTLTCTEKTQNCTENSLCNCLCIFYHDTNTVECVCSLHVLLPNITYNTNVNDLQECKCLHQSINKDNSGQLICECVRKDSFEPRYDLILIKLLEVRINTTIILTFLEGRWEFQHEVFNRCNGGSLESPIILACTDNTQQCTKENNCNCLCVFHQASDASECLCSPHVLLPNITYNTNVNDLQKCKCLHQSINKDNGGQLICECVRKDSFEPRYDLILIKLLEVRINTTIILTFLEGRWEFQHEVFNRCNGISLKSPIILACREDSQQCTKENNCNCLCVFHQASDASECLCSPHVLLPNITYNTNVNDLQKCKCLHQSGLLICECVRKPSFEPRYDLILIKLLEVRINTTIILTFLEGRWEFQHEVFNRCNGGSLESPIILACTDNTQQCTKENNCNCLCVFHQASDASECLCSPHVLLPNITYNTNVNDLQKCKCLHQSINKDNGGQLICECVRKDSFEPRYDLILIKLLEVRINTTIILTFLEGRWEFQHEVFNRCNGGSLESPIILACTDNTQQCTKENNCNCLCVFHQASDASECLCSPHVLLPNITYNTNVNDLQKCKCLHQSINNDNGGQLICECVRKDSFEPRYDLILIKLLEVRINTTIILTFLEGRWEFQHEVFNRCNGGSLESPIILACTDNTQQCTKENNCNCLCVFHQASDASECLCSPHVLLPNITYNTNVNDLQECKCLHQSINKDNGGQLICECVRKDSFEPRYDLILINLLEVRIDINIILTYLKGRWEFQHEVFNLCNGTSWKSPLILTCSDKTEACKENNPCNCLCVFDQKTSMTECVCSTHVLLPNITYNITKNDLQGCTCIHDGDVNQITCKCEKKSSFNPSYEILIELYEIQIDIAIILKHYQERWQFNHESFIQCSGSTPSIISCGEITELYVGQNYCYCLCVFHKVKNNNAVKCLCSTHVLLPDIKYMATKNDLQGCNCLHKGKANQLTCQCKKKLSFDPNYDLILIEVLQVEIDINIIRTYLLQRSEFKYESFNECSGTNLNTPLILNCAQKTEIYTGNNRCNCLCVFYHANSTTECLCSAHASLVTFTYNATVDDIQGCSCQHEGNSYQLICNCKKKESFEPRYDLILLDTKGTLTVQFILNYFKVREEFRFETFNELSCKNSTLPLLCTWTDKNEVSTKEVSYNCLCILSAFKKRAANCLCSKHILIPDITYNTNHNKLQSCECRNTLKILDQLICECTTKESFKPNYGEVEVNLGYRDFIEIIVIQELIKNTRAFRHELLNLCNCTKDNRNVLCNCQNDAKSYTVQAPGFCLCTWLSDRSKTAECICNDHILDVKYKFSSSLLKLANCSCQNTENDIRSLVCECDEMYSVDKRYASFIINIPSEYNEIQNVAEFISTNFTTSDKFFKECYHQNFHFCLTNKEKTLPVLCLSSKTEQNKNGCVRSLYIGQPIILYNNNIYDLYRCEFGTEWHCQFVNDTLRAQTHATLNINIKNRHVTIVQNVTRYVNNTNFWNVVGPQFENYTIIRNVTRYVTNPNHINVGNLNIGNYKIIQTVTNPKDNVEKKMLRTVRINPLGNL